MNDEFKSYVASYRRKIRAAAKGEVIGELKATGGKIYSEAQIIEVTPAGIQIRHRDGTARVLFLNLPASFTKRFQFDEEEMVAFLTEERERLGVQEEALEKEIVAVMSRQREERIAYLQERIPLLENRIREDRRLVKRRDAWGLTDRELSCRYELRRIRPELEYLLREQQAAGDADSE